MNRKSQKNTLTLNCSFRSVVASFVFSLICLNTQAMEPGLTPGELSVSASGAAEYSVPIAVPPGTAGMAPSLSLNYSSQGGNGPLGVGWSLNGLSAITRCPQTLAQDGVNRAVKIDIADKFCLDGQRLIPISGAYGANNTQYQTEINNFSLVTSYGDTGAGPTHFIVITKSGRTMQYGLDGSKVEAQGSSHIRVWALNRIKDTVNNYIDFTYKKDTDKLDYRISKIDYTGNLNTQTGTYSSVQFEYIDRPRQTSGYIADHKFAQRKLISHIKTYNKTAMVRDYRLTYDTAGLVGQPRLNNVKECAGNGKCFTPITFTWSPELTGFGATTSNNNIILTGEAPQWVDFNADGKTDFCLIKSTDHLACHLSDGATLTTTPILTSSPTNKGFEAGREWADFNGDGMADFCRLLGTSDNQVAGCYLSAGNSFGDSLQSGSLTGGWGQKVGRRWVDFNSDGRADYCRVLNSSIVACTLSGGNGFNATITSHNLPHGTGSASEVKNTREWVDINGDGMADFCRTLSDRSKACTLSNGTSFGKTFKSAPLSNPGGITEPTYNNINWVDINGDGNKDICGKWVDKNSNVGGFADIQRLVRAKCTLFTGSRFGESVESGRLLNTYFTEPSINGGIIRSNDGNMLWKDINNDGLVDTCLEYTRPLSSSSFKGYFAVCTYSNGNGFEKMIDGPAPFQPSVLAIPPKSSLVDINGDAMADHCYAGSAANGYGVACRMGKTRPQMRITGIINSLSSQTKIIYKPLTNASVYTKDSNPDNTASYPNLDTQASMYVVSSIQSDNGIGGTQETRYNYAGAKAHLKGRGFLGFRWMLSVDMETQIKTTTVYHQDFPFIGMVHSTTTYQPDWTEISSIENTFDQIDYNDGRRFPYVITSVQKNYELDSSLIRDTTTNYVYDTFGNPTSITVLTTDGGSERFQTTTTNEYINEDDASKWYLGRLTKSTVAQTSAAGTQQRVSAFDYNLGTNGLLHSETIEPDNAALKLTTLYRYDDYGNKIAVTLSGGSAATAITPRTTTTDYNASGQDLNHTQGQFPIKVTNAEGETETHTYDARFGVMTSLTGPNKLTTTWQYDSFGRNQLEKRADGTQTSIVREWYSGPGFGKLMMRTSATGSPVVIEISDALGRVILTQTTGRVNSISGNGNTTINSQTDYNTLGQVLRISRPYFSGDPKHWTTFTYDLLNRPETEMNDKGVVNYTYIGLETIVRNQLGQETTRILNVRGELVEVIDANGNSTIYEYDSFGNQTKEVDTYGNNIIMDYNIRGQKTSMDDPDMGEWSYTNNVLGELVSQTDAEHQTTIMKYDKVGRMIEQTDPESTSFWVYGSVTNSDLADSNAIGKLVYTQRGSDEKIYTKYDNFGRPNEVTTKLFNESKNFITGTTYDNASRVKTITYPTSKAYPSGLEVTNHYDNNGYLTEVIGPNDIKYWEALDQNAQGQVTAFNMGNAKTMTTRVYDPVDGLVSSIDTINDHGSHNIQNLGFVFDDIGNLVERTGQQYQGSSLSESFAYDNLNRLTSSLVSGGTQKIYNYDALGNIISKTGVGNYEYNSSRPHAVTNTSTGNKQYTYDANGNMKTGDSRTITWSSFNKPNKITKGGYTTRFVYGANYNRIRQKNNEKTIFYINGLFELEETFSNTTSIHYIKAEGSTIAIVKSHDSGDALETRYLHKDHLGGIEAITDENGNMVQQLSYDPHGKRRNADWSDVINPIPTLNFDTQHGFTGHEHLDGVGFIHMNGRVYDPALGRFTSADPFVQFPDSSQSLNRYSYVMNNPLSFTDPSGFGLFSFVKNIFKNKVFRIVGSVALAAVSYNFVAGLKVFAVAGNAAGAGYIGAITHSVSTLGTIAASGSAGFVSGFVGSRGNLKAGLKGAISGAAFAYLGQQVRTGYRQWRSGRGQLYYYERDISEIVGYKAPRLVDKIEGYNLFVNGVLNDLEDALARGAEQFSEQSFTLLHNPSHGFIADSVETILGKFVEPSNISKQLAGLIKSHEGLLSIRPHSQGGLITSNALKILKGANFSNVTVTFNGVPINSRRALNALKVSGARLGGFNANSFDFVPNVLGMNTFNPIKLGGSFISTPLLFIPSLSTHRVYRR